MCRLTTMSRTVGFLRPKESRPSQAANAISLVLIELRAMICHHGLKGEQHVPMYSSYASQDTFKYFTEYVVISQYRRNCYQARPSFLPGMCRTSKELYVETVQESLRDTKFVSSSIDDNTALTGFLRSVSGDPECVRELYFDCFSRLKSTAVHNMYLELAVRCKGLRELKIMLHNLEMRHHTAHAA